MKIGQPNLSEHVKRPFIVDLMILKRNGKTFCNEISFLQNIYKERDDVAAINFDLMQNLPLQNIPVQNIFYLR